MATATVGALRVVLGANTAEFTQAMDRAELKAQTTLKGIQRLVSDFSGQRLINEAEKMAQALGKIDGGLKSLTQGELTRVGSVIDGAVAKFKALGQEVPPHIAKLHGELKALEKQTTATTAVQPPLALGVGKWVAGLVSATAAIGAVRGLWGAYTSLIRDSVQSFANAESAQVKLVAALRAQGTATPQVIRQQRELAAEFQRTTVYADDLLMEMQGLLVQVGNVAPAQMQAALTAATDLASGLGIDLRTATMLVGKAFEGETGSLKRYGIVVDEAKLKTQGITAVLDAVQQKFGGQAQAEVATYAGQVRQLANAWDDLKEKIGAVAVSAPEISALLFTITQLLQDMTREGGEAETTIGKLWQAWEKYIEIGRMVVPGLMAWNNLLDEQAHKAEAARRAAMVKPITLPTPLGLPDITPIGLKVFEEQAKKDKVAAEAAVRAAEAFKKAQDALFGRDLIERSTSYARQLGDISNVTKLTTDKKNELYRVVSDAIDVYQRLGLTAPRALHEIANATRPVIETTMSLAEALEHGLLGKIVTDIGFIPPLINNASQQFGLLGLNILQVNEYTLGWKKSNDLLRDSVQDANTSTHEWTDGLGGLSRSLAQLAQIMGGGGSGVLGLISRWVAAVDVAQNASDTMLVGVSQLTGANKNFGEGLLNLASGALGAAAAIGQATSQGNAFQRALGGGLAGAQIGFQLGGPLGAVIGGGVGALVGIGRALFGVSQEILKVREEVKGFQKDLNATATATQKNEAAMSGWGDRGALTLIQLRDALISIGRSGQEAEALVKALWDTDHPDRARRAMEEINRVLKEQQAILERNTKEAGDLFDDLMDAARAYGGIPPQMQASIDKLISLNLLTEEQVASLRELATVAGPTYDQINEAAGVFQARVDQLGASFQQQRIDQTAKKYVEAFDTLRRGVADLDLGAITADAREELSALVQDAIRNKAVLPAQLKEYVLELQRTGQLLDENGEALTDISDLRWGERMKTEAEIAQEGWERLIAKMEEFFDRLAGGLEKIANRPPIDIDFRANLPDLNYTQPVPMARGGIVPRPTLALIGERGPELVSPLNALPAILSSMADRFAFDSPGMRLGEVDVKQSGSEDTNRLLDEINRTMRQLQRSFDQLPIVMRGAVVGAV